MSATVTYKGSTLTTATNQTRVLNTAGKYMEDDVTITDVSTIPSGSISITSNDTYDVTNYASAIVNVSGGGGIGTLLVTKSLGSFNTTSTTATDTGQTVSVTGINNYDMLIVETSVDLIGANKHECTVAGIWLTAGTSRGTKNGATIMSNKWNMKISSSLVETTRQSTTAYGLYPYSCTISNGTLTIVMYIRYNSTQTGTINNSYTTRVYGIKFM